MIGWLLGSLLLAHGPVPSGPVLPEQQKTAIEGLWLGILRAGITDLRLGFEFKSTEKGTLIGKMTSVDQGGVALPCTSVNWKDESLAVSVAFGTAKYSGKRSKGGDIEGEFEQNGLKFPLKLVRVDKLPTVKRPQLPVKPYPYPSKEVTFKNEKANATFSGTLTLPTGQGPFPAVVLVSGSGPQDRDETLFQHKPFLVIADHFAKNGIACLRYDDRGTGKSTGNHSLANTIDFASDAQTALLFLRQQESIDPSRVGICGHSEGGLIGPLVAVNKPDAVAFLILLAGPGITGERIILKQMSDGGKQVPGYEKELVKNLEMAKRIIPIAKTALTTKDSLTAMKASVLKFESEQGNTKPPAEVYKPWGPLVEQLSSPWMRCFVGHDPLPVLEKVKCQVLALNGALDTQVISSENLPVIATAFSGPRANLLTSREFPKVNHLFQHCQTGFVNEYGLIEETFAPEILGLMSQWVLDHQSLTLVGPTPKGASRHLLKPLGNLRKALLPGRQKNR